ncbi:hypothetical protein Tco_1435355, partial [Tanacetum coccineum]
METILCVVITQETSLESESESEIEIEKHGNDGIKEIDNIKLEKSAREIKGYGLEDFYKSWTRTYSAYSSDDSDSDHTVSIGEELQEGGVLEFFTLDLDFVFK